MNPVCDHLQWQLMVGLAKYSKWTALWRRSQIEIVVVLEKWKMSDHFCRMSHQKKTFGRTSRKVVKDF